VRALVFTILAACGSAAPPPPAHPATPAGDCAEAPPGKRSLAARIDVERGTGTITIDGATQSGCALFDLPPGTHHVLVKVAGAQGFGVNAQMQVLDPPQRYDLFQLSCGLPGSCDAPTLHAWAKGIDPTHMTMTDPCGAAKLTGIQWTTEMLDDVHPKELTVTFDLHVYSKPSGKPPHDPSCPEK
jgi:hypothetical protein